MPTQYEKDYQKAYKEAQDYHFHDPHAYASTCAQTEAFFRDIRKATLPIRRDYRKCKASPPDTARKPQSPPDTITP